MRTFAEAVQLYHDERYEDAVRRLRLVVEFDAGNAQAWMYYGAALGHLGRWDEAVTALRQLIRLEPENATAYCDLASALGRLGDLAAAADAADAALALAPEHPEARRLQQRLRQETAPPAEPAPDPATPPAEATTPRVIGIPRQRFLLIVLGLLLAVVAVRLARLPGAQTRQLIDLATRLDRAELQLAEIASRPGEDFDAADRVRADLDRVETELVGLTATAGGPEPVWLRARLRWLRDFDAEGAKTDLHRLMEQLRQRAPDERLKVGLTTRELLADAHRLRAEILIARASGEAAATQLRQAASDLHEAASLSPSPRDSRLRAKLDQVWRERARPR